MKVSKGYLYEWIDDACQIFMFCKVPKYTRSLVKETSLPAKYYVADIGMRNAVLLPQSSDEGKALENIVFSNVNLTLGEDDKVFFFCEETECDFVVVRSGNVAELVQVCWRLDKDNYEREFEGLAVASLATKCSDCRVVTFEQEGTYNYKGLDIKVESIWKG